MRQKGHLQDLEGLFKMQRWLGRYMLHKEYVRIIIFIRFTVKCRQVPQQVIKTSTYTSSSCYQSSIITIRPFHNKAMVDKPEDDNRQEGLVM